MVEIIKVYRESLPALRLIGKRYTDSDRGIDGGFGKT
ncbi:MAG TPA: AraC family transcriptional regulator, partial [Firmicutes bacterium]|nr:AraC family transcriptional regulator [Bacillota bacterium]